MTVPHLFLQKRVPFFPASAEKKRFYLPDNIDKPLHQKGNLVNKKHSDPWSGRQ
jgi:hypothetical protein